MADFSLTTLFVVPDGNTIPTTGSTEDLVAGKFGFFRNDYTPATAANAAAAPYIYLAQGRANKELLASKRSDKLSKSRVSEFYKVSGVGTTQNQITEVSAISVKIPDEVTFTFRLFSNYIDIAFFNGLTRSVTVPAACGTDGTAISDEAIVDAVIAKAAQDVYISKFLTLTKTGTDAGGDVKLVVTGKALDKYGRVSDDIDTNQFEYDRLTFKVYVYKATETTADFFTLDKCHLLATVTTTQESSYIKGVSEEITILQERFYSFQAHMKHLYRHSGWNQMYEDYVKPNSIYDTYVIKYKPVESEPGVDAQIIIAAIQGQTTTLEAILTAAIGAPANKT